ncbi:hypothetical protein ACFL67_03200 [candidate division KSB1 bacterium]
MMNYKFLHILIIIAVFSNICNTQESSVPRIIDLSDSTYSDFTKINGTKFPGHLGYGLACGDINGDGYDDIIMIEDYYSQYTENFYPYGTARILFGSDSIRQREEFSAVTGETMTIYLKYMGPSKGIPGTFKPYCKDLDGDGYDDIVIDNFGIVFGTPNFSNNDSINYLYDDDKILYLTDDNLLEVADIDRDGMADLIVGNMEYSSPVDNTKGIVKIIFGDPLLRQKQDLYNNLSGLRVKWIFTGDVSGR